MNKHLNPLNFLGVNLLTATTTVPANTFSGCGYDWCGQDMTWDPNVTYCFSNDYCWNMDDSACSLSFDMCLCNDLKSGGADLQECSCDPYLDSRRAVCRTVNGTGINDASFCGPWNIQIDDVSHAIILE